jgi:hypothetical protein
MLTLQALTAFWTLGSLELMLCCIADIPEPCTFTPCFFRQLVTLAMPPPPKEPPPGARAEPVLAPLLDGEVAAGDDPVLEQPQATAAISTGPRIRSRAERQFSQRNMMIPLTVTRASRVS